MQTLPTRELNPGPSPCEATVLTTTATVLKAQHPLSSHKKKKSCCVFLLQSKLLWPLKNLHSTRTIWRSSSVRRETWRQQRRSIRKKLRTWFRNTPTPSRPWRRRSRKQSEGIIYNIISTNIGTRLFFILGLVKWEIEKKKQRTKVGLRVLVKKGVMSSE